MNTSLISEKREDQTRQVEDCQESKLPRRDWILLPLVAIVTICLIGFSAEIIARHILPASKTFLSQCLLFNDPGGIRGVPNSVCTEKTPESEWTVYKFNGCGDYAEMPCGPKPPGSYRIVVVGSSFAMGQRVTNETRLSTVLSQQLSQRAHREINVYNQATGDGFPQNVQARFNDALALKPDMILWPLTPYDLKNVSAVEAGVYRTKTPALIRLKDDILAGVLLDRVRTDLNATYAAVALRHFEIQEESPDRYVTSYLLGPDSETGFLKADFSPDWKANLRNFDRLAADVEKRSLAAGVPFVAFLAPTRAQAAMISLGHWPGGYDPYQLDAELHRIIVNYGGVWIDILPAYRTWPHPELDYLPVDGHQNARAHAMISGLLVDSLMSNGLPALQPPSQTPVEMQRSR